MAKHVLVVEDDESITTSLSFLLTRAGFEVAVESDGTKALDTILAQVPDVLLLDVMLPRMDGYEVLRRVRADQRTSAMPVIMLTAKGQPENRETAMECGANLFITKPFANAEVVGAVERLAG